MVVLRQIKNEFKELVVNPAILGVIILPIFMSKVVTYAMKGIEAGFLLLCVWILFAEVMVGIMLTGPNLIEERESKTFDALLCTPLTYGKIIVSKCVPILICSLFSQIMVFVVNEGINSKLPSLLGIMLLGGTVFVEIGAIIGLLIESSKTGSAISAMVMVALYLVVSVYPSLPKWTYSIFMILPSVEVVEVMNALINSQGILWKEVGLLSAWFVILTGAIFFIGKKKY
ncbi:MAG: ABC transporter permease [Lachnospiraceae bacterium]|nr:ABC transporter permease [Lachnospiraceae bacterium]